MRESRSTMNHCTSCERDPLKPIGGAVGGSGCGGEGQNQRKRPRTVRGRCGTVMGVEIGGSCVEIRIKVLEGIAVHEWYVWGYRDSVEIGGEGFTLYFSSSSLSDVLPLFFPMHTHTHAVHDILIALFLSPHPSTHPSSQRP